MPNCFQLFRKVDGGREKEATPLNTVDRELCRLLDIEEHPRCYVIGWFDCIGWLIACKNDCDLGTPKLRAELLEWFDGGTNEERYLQMVKCLDYLEANYVSSSWVEIGKHRES